MNMLVPVTLPPGLLKTGYGRIRTVLQTDTNTTGVDAVARFAASAEHIPPVAAIRAGSHATNLFARASSSSK